MPKILLVEDDKDLADMVRSYLVHERFEVEVVNDGEEAVRRVKTYGYDLIVLDLGLPLMDGLTVLRELRSRGTVTPVIILTGKNAIEEKEQGLDAGADDYVTKPFHLKELGARIRAILRRPFQESKGEVLTACGITLDIDRFEVRKGGELLQLLPREFQLLELLMRYPNQIFSGEAIVERIWPTGGDSAQDALRTTMRRLRGKIDPDGAILKTVHGAGYVLESAGE